MCVGASEGAWSVSGVSGSATLLLAKLLVDGVLSSAGAVSDACTSVLDIADCCHEGVQS